jgi:hypothetical protein
LNELHGNKLVLLGMLVFYNFFDSLSPRGMPFWVPVYGATIVLVCIGCLSSFLTPNRRVLSSPAFLCISLMLVAGFVQAFFNPDVSSKYLVSDFVKLSVFAAFFFIAADRRLGLDNHDALIVIMLLAFPAFFSPFSERFIGAYASELQTRFESTGRYQPPHYILPLLISFAFFYTRSVIQSIALYILFVCVALLSLFSQQRFNFAMCLLSPLLCLASELRFAGSRNLQKLVVAVAVSLAGLLLAGIVAYTRLDSIELSELLSRLRFAELLSDGKDTSTLGRFNEASDVLLEMRSADWSKLFFGFGHGAELYVRATELHINASGGQLHHIHFGLFQLLFRYGLFGGLAFCFLLLRSFLQIVPFSNGSDESVERFFCCAGFLALLHFSFFGALHDLLGAFVIAGAMFFRSCNREELARFK